MSTGLDNYRKSLFWASIVSGCILLFAIFAPNGPWLAEIIFSALLKISIFMLWFSILTLPFMFYFQKTRKAAAYITESAYFIFSVTLWFMSLKTTYWTLGPIVTIIGLCLVGLGCIPFSMMITWYFKMWIDLQILGVLLLLCILCRATAHLYYTNEKRNVKDIGYL